MYRLEIALQSDLCAADGDGYASTIDSDIVTDRKGIPFIPARRLKGCLLEAAKYIEASNIEQIFGVTRSMTSGSLHITNARIKDYDAFAAEAAKQGLSPKEITECFTSTIASTAIDEDGSVKENSLRFLRAVSSKTPWNQEEPLTFYADVELDAVYAEEFRRICRALRHIGYKRSRGFGNVLCRLEDCTERKEPVFPKIPNDEARYTLTYAVHLDEPLMLPGKALDETRDYVGGGQVIGALAGVYLKDHPADAAFEELFLSDDVRFSNLYLTDEELREYIPVPQYLGRSKNKEDAGKIINILEPTDKIVKPIKTGYIRNELEVRTALTERIYHNAVNSNNESKLYTQNVLQADQTLRGTITAPGSKLRSIVQLMKGAPLRFGRSKTAQYAQCSITAAAVNPEQSRHIEIPAGEYAVYALASDAILMDKYGNYDPSLDVLCGALGLDAEGIDRQHSALKYTTVTGFQTVIGLQNAHLRAVAAGSFIAVKAEKPLTLPDTLLIGERQNAGFGAVKVFPANALLANADNCLKPTAPKVQAVPAIVQWFDQLNKDEDMRKTAVEYAVKQALHLEKTWNTSFLGRVTLMVKQSDSKPNLDKRIESIKTKPKQEAARKMLNNANPEHYGAWKHQQQYLLTVLTVLKYRIKQQELAKQRGKKA